MPFHFPIGPVPVAFHNAFHYQAVLADRLGPVRLLLEENPGELRRDASSNPSSVKKRKTRTSTLDSLSTSRTNTPSPVRFSTTRMNSSTRKASRRV